MNQEILLLSEKIKDAYQGDPWFGRSIKEILSEIDESIAFQKPNGQHSIIELLWHMITWREFILDRLHQTGRQSLEYFEQIDWREIDPSETSLWQQGLQRFNSLQNELVEVIQQQKDEILSQRVPDKKYDFRKLLYGIVEHDIYHTGQIAYVKKLLTVSH